MIIAVSRGTYVETYLVCRSKSVSLKVEFIRTSVLEKFAVDGRPAAGST